MSSIENNWREEGRGMSGGKKIGWGRGGWDKMVILERQDRYYI